VRGRGDRARTTFWNFVLMAASAAVGLIASVQGSLPLFFDGFIVLFAFSGVGNGSTEKIPAILRAKLPDDGRESRRPANALIGIAGAIGAFGGVLVDVAFRQSFLSYRNGNGANTGFHRVLRGVLRAHVVRLSAEIAESARRRQGRPKRGSLITSLRHSRGDLALSAPRDPPIASKIAG
jgi:nitrate/nitrite transporter NarK